MLYFFQGQDKFSKSINGKRGGGGTVKRLEEIPKTVKNVYFETNTFAQNLKFFCSHKTLWFKTVFSCVTYFSIHCSL